MGGTNLGQMFAGGKGTVVYPGKGRGKKKKMFTKRHRAKLRMEEARELRKKQRLDERQQDDRYNKKEMENYAFNLS